MIPNSLQLISLNVSFLLLCLILLPIPLCCFSLWLEYLQHTLFRLNFNEISLKWLLLLSYALKIPDSDLLKRRISQKVDPLTNEVYIKSVYDPEKPLKNNDTKQEAFGEEDNDDQEANEDEKQEGEETVEDEFSDDLVSRAIVALSLFTLSM